MAENYEPVFVYENRGRLSPEKLTEKGLQLKHHCEENGYQQSGSLSISEPMSRCGSELQWITGYCRSHGISKILVDGLLDNMRTLFAQHSGYLGRRPVFIYYPPLYAPP